MRRVLATPRCPRCGGFIPNDETPGAYPGARSRVDNKTEVCSKCGTAEAYNGIAGTYMGFTDWVNPPNEFEVDVKDLLSAEELSVKTCDHVEWRWLDCEECKETIGVCGEKVCSSCGETV